MKFLLMMAAVLSLVSCDMLRRTPFEVIGWSPGGGIHESPEHITVKASFSTSPDRASVERYFTLTEDGGEREGRFEWDGDTVVFIPSRPLEPNHDYQLSVSSEAHDRGGVSLERSFQAAFSTRPDGKRPELLSGDPADGGIMAAARGEISLVFSAEIDLVSCADEITISPAVSGVWRAEGKTVIFTPAEDWKTAGRYTVTVSAGLAAKDGRTAGKEARLSFTAGTDTEAPVLLGAWRRDGADEIPLTAADSENAAVENAGWGKDSLLVLRFSEEVDSLKIKNRISCEGGPRFDIASGPEFSAEILFKPEKAAAYGSRFVIRLDEGAADAAGNTSAETYRWPVYADANPPVRFVGMRMPMAPGAADVADSLPQAYSADDAFGDFPVTEKEGHFPYLIETPVWIELYFEIPAGAAFDLLELGRSFSVESTNGALIYKNRAAADSGFTWAEAAPGWEPYTRYEVRGVLTNTVKSGIVSFVIKAGGVTAEEVRLPLLK